MIVKVRQHGISPRRADSLVRAAHFYLDQMIPLPHRVRIKTFRLLLDTHSKTHGEYGYQSDLAEIPGLYTVAIARDCSLKSAISYLAHEFIHLNQSLSQRLSLVRTGTGPGVNEWFWEGTSFGVDPYKRFTTRDSHYENLPWEREAYENQTEWAVRFLS